MKVILICNGCGKPATRTLLHYDEEDSLVEYGKVNGFPVPFKRTVTKNDIIPNFSLDGSLIPQGIAFKASKTIKYFDYLNTHDLNHQYWLNLDDIEGHILRNSNWDKGYGCCGVIAIHGKPNRRCICGHDIGYEISECFSLKVFVPNNETTTWASG